ncbi:hypothetical protein [Streptomyces sp. NPDC059262]|uniref:MmyB family transcriptional regulator n=1 Tax=Streptomyces sp. NPDC059262 TaxID=3346797 RepID=UPI0036AD9B87
MRVRGCSPDCRADRPLPGRCRDPYRRSVDRVRIVPGGGCSNTPDVSWHIALPPHPTIRHPEVGDIHLDCDVLIVPGADLRMVTYTAAAGSDDAGKLDLLRVTSVRSATVRS